MESFVRFGANIKQTRVLSAPHTFSIRNSPAPINLHGSGITFSEVESAWKWAKRWTQSKRFDTVTKRQDWMEQSPTDSQGHKTFRPQTANVCCRWHFLWRSTLASNLIPFVWNSISPVRFPKHRIWSLFSAESAEMKEKLSPISTVCGNLQKNSDKGRVYLMANQRRTVFVTKIRKPCRTGN